jgi:putative ABC transport system permease protein
MNIRFLKVLRDLRSDYTKNFMLVLAIALGVFGIGVILGAYGVLTREMSFNYLGTNPASATIEIEDDISPTLLDSVRALPGVKIAERHATIVARMKVGERWNPLLLFVIDNFSGKQTNKVRFLTGHNNPGTGTMLVERTALVVMEASEGDLLGVKTPNGSTTSLKITGTVHDAGLAPAWQEQAGYGYISLATLHGLGETQGFNQLRLIFDGINGRQEISSRAEDISRWLEDHGHHVHQIQVPPPGRHPHQSQMNAVLSIFIVFSYLILILGSILVATSVSTMMVKQVRQIGVMKTIGARPAQVGAMYVLLMLIISATSLVISVPLSRLVASLFVNQVSTLLNLEIADATIPIWVPMTQVGSGILLPLLMAAIPVIRASRISVRAALDNYGINPLYKGRASRMIAVSEAVKISIRNVFRQRWRLALTLSLLAAGGAIFMTALNVSDAWKNNLARITKQRLYDLEVRLNERMTVDSLVTAISDMKGVKDVEGWDHSSTAFAGEKGFEVTHTYPDKGHGSFSILALPPDTRMLTPEVVEGTWLTPANGNNVVLNQLARVLRSDIRIGDEIELALEGTPTRWKVIGFTEDVGSPATAYVSIDAFRSALGVQNMSKALMISYNDRSRDNARTMNGDIENLLSQKRISIASSIPVWLLHNAVAAHMKVLVNSLLVMAVLMAFVGAIGLMSAMSMNVMERTREIGVMRAIGGTPAKIRNIITLEGFIIGAISFVGALLLGIALSVYMGLFIGNLAFKTPLSLAISLPGVAMWLLILGVGSFAATYFPARRASKLTTREALAYE